MRFHQSFMVRTIFIALLCMTARVGVSRADSPVCINEIMASNISSLADEDGDFTDWIELYNSADSTVSLDGYAMTDDPSVMDKWLFPPVTIAPGEYLVVFASDKDRAQTVLHWEAVITLNDEWRYTTDTASVPDGWRDNGFDDSGWDTGPSGIGADPEETMGGTTFVTDSRSFYMRKTFTITDLDHIESAVFSMDYSQGFVAYLNGHEIARSNVGTPGVPPLYHQWANSVILPVYYEGGIPEAYDIDSFADTLVPGENVLAVQVHWSGLWGHLFGMPFLSFARAHLPPGSRTAQSQLGLEGQEQSCHTNFRINADDDVVMLIDPDGAIADSILVSGQTPDVSFGRSPDGTEDWRFFSTATPGGANGGGFAGFSAAVVEVSVPNGLYTVAQTISLSTDSPGGTIRYTTDGSLPDEHAAEYLTPVVIDTTTVIRAVVFEEDCLPGPVLTKTYVIDEPSTIPVVSLTFIPSDLWDDDTGIYVQGNSDKPGGYPDAPVSPAANWNEEWEKPVHIEFFEPDGSIGFDTDAGARIHGKQNRRLPQKSLAVFFRDGYGIDELEYPLFPGTRVQTFTSFILRNSGHDWETTHIRDMYLQRLFEPLDLEMQRGRPTHVYLNGVYWGMLNLRDKLNEDYLDTHRHIDPDAVDIIDDYHAHFTRSGIYQAHPMTDDATTWTCYVSEGSADQYNALLEYMVNHDESDPDVYAYLKTRIDMENFADYMISRIFIADPDGPGHNTKLWRPRTPDGRWRWLMYDTDFGGGLQDSPFGVPGPAYLADILRYYTRTVQSSEDNTDYDDSRSPDGNFMLYSLLGNDEHAGNEEFRSYFANRYADLLNTIFSKEEVTGKLAAIKAAVEPEIARHIDRWAEYMPFLGYGVMTTINQWYDNIASLEQFAELRTQHARTNLIDNLDLGSEAALTVTNNQPQGGTVRLNTLDINGSPFNGIYFTGLPVSLTAIPKPGWRFDGWSGAAVSADVSISLDLSTETAITATFVEDTAATNTVMFSEINYHSCDEHDCGDWVELYSSYTVPLDLGGWEFRDSDDAHVFVIPAGTMIQPGGYLVLCEDSEDFTAQFPQVGNVAGSFGFGLSGDGELIRLYDSSGTLIDSLTYGSSDPWPGEPDGNGPTLELRSTTLDNALYASWEVSDGHGTPGIANDQALAVEDSDQTFPQAFRIGRNYPNPFNPATIIPYDIPRSARVRIDIYNALGQHVTGLVDCRHEPGTYRVRFSPEDLATGQYFALLTAGEYRQAIPMLYVK